MSATAARVVAVEVLDRMVRDGAWLQHVLDQRVASAGLDERDRAFVTRLVRGTVQLMPTLDGAIAEASDRPGRIKPRVRNVLRLGAYELLCMKTPAAVAVDQGVSLVRARDPHAAGFANAVLRRISVRAADFPWGDPAEDLDALARLSGFGDGLKAQLLAAIGEGHTRTLMEASLDPAPLYVVANPLRTQSRAHDDLVQPCPDIAGCGSAVDPAAFVRSGLLNDGSYIAADASAQLVAALVPLEDGSRVLDLAAGRGTKTALLAFRAAREGLGIELHASDLHEWKTKLLTERMLELGVVGVSSHVADAADASSALKELGAAYDAVLVDAPCSGLGTLRRHPEIAWRYVDGVDQGFPSLSARMLETAAQLVRPGGFVVYSTCTVLPAENGDVLRSFLGSEAGSAFSVTDISALIPGWMRADVSEEGFVQTMPRRGGPDGHFVAVLQRG